MGISMVFLALLGVYIFLLFNYRPLMGDDFTFYYYKEVSGYVDKDSASDFQYESKIGIPFSERLEIMKNSYQTFSGRVISMICSMLFSMVNNRTVFALLAVLVYLGILLLGARLVFGSTKEVLRHPFIVILYGSFLWLYNEGVGNLYMFTMLFHYGVTYLLWLVLLYFSLDRAYTDKKVSVKLLAGVNLFGIFAGLTHEMIGACCLLMIAAMALFSKGFRKGIREIRFYIGAFIGYLFCFFAPGNFNRAGTDHDAAIHAPYPLKLLKSVKQHAATFLQMDEVGKWILMIAVILLIGSLIIKIRKGQKIAWKKALLWQAFVVLSIVLWAAVSYVPKYGILLAMIAQLTAFLRLLYETEKAVKGKDSEDQVTDKTIMDKDVERKKIANKAVMEEDVGITDKDADDREAIGKAGIGSHKADKQRVESFMQVVTMIISAVFLLAVTINLRWVPTMIQETRYRFELVAEAAQAGLPEVVVPSYSEKVTGHNVMVPNNLNNSAFYRGKKVTWVYYGTKIIVEGHDE